MQTDGQTSSSISPFVSVIIPVYNGQKIACQAIDSALEQTYPEREIIVVDDGSTDSTLEVLEGYGDKIRLLPQKRQGPARARNYGIEQATGEYVAFLDFDDVWFPEKLEVHMKVMRSHPTVGLTFSNLEAMDNDGRRLGYLVVKRPQHRATDGYCPTWEDLLTGYSIATTSVVAQKESILKVGGFDADLFPSPSYEDRDLFLRLREIMDFHYLDVCLGYYRVNEGHVLGYRTGLLPYAKKYLGHPRLRQNFNLRDDLAKFCCYTTFYTMKVMLKTTPTKGSHEMLVWLEKELREFHASFKSIFGYPYDLLSRLDSMDLSKYDLNAATSILLYLYLLRPDLQNVFPEVSSGDLRRLISWGAAVARGHVKEDDCSLLFPCREELEQLRKSQSPLFGVRNRAFRLWQHFARLVIETVKTNRNAP